MVRLLDTRVTVDSTRTVFGGLPEIFHTDRVGKSEVARLHALGVKVFIERGALEAYIQPLQVPGPLDGSSGRAWTSS